MGIPEAALGLGPAAQVSEPKALGDASMRVPLPAAISAALEALRQAQMRAEIPEHHRF